MIRGAAASPKKRERGLATPLPCPPSPFGGGRRASDVLQIQDGRQNRAQDRVVPVVVVTVGLAAVVPVVIAAAEPLAEVVGVLGAADIAAAIAVKGVLIHPAVAVV